VLPIRAAQRMSAGGLSLDIMVPNVESVHLCCDNAFSVFALE